MIRFKTVEAEKPEKTPAKLAEVPVVPVMPVPQVEPETAEPDAAGAKPKGLTRKTPLRAKKPVAGLFES